jgi:hypothetical protein
MNYSIEQHREYLAPAIYDCSVQLYEKIKANNDMITYHTWKELVSLLVYNNTTIPFAFNMFLNKNKVMPNHEEYKTIIMATLMQYQRNGYVQNRS